MKRFVLAFLSACCALTLAAQETIPVNYTGEKPGIGDFAWAFVSAIDDDEEVDVDESANAFKQAWIRYRQGAAQQDGAWISYALPRSGKDITVTSWYDDKTTQRILKWNGHGFSF